MEIELEIKAWIKLKPRSKEAKLKSKRISSVKKYETAIKTPPIIMNKGVAMTAVFLFLLATILIRYPISRASIDLIKKLNGAYRAYPKIKSAIAEDSPPTIAPTRGWIIEARSMIKTSERLI